MLRKEIEKLQEKTQDLTCSLGGYVYTKKAELWELTEKLEATLNGESISLKQCADTLQEILDRVDDLSLLIEIVATDSTTDYKVRKERNELIMAVNEIAQRLRVIINS